jgi:hypothetical protein
LLYIYYGGRIETRLNKRLRIFSDSRCKAFASSE